MAKKSQKQQKERLFEEKLVPAKSGSGELFDVSFGDEDSKPVECLGMKFPNDAARRAHFIELLREKLKDPEFRKIEGFPIGGDEDILALSDPPYYTACPNPFAGQFVEHCGNAYCEDTDDYELEPLAYDVSEGKNDPIYNAHSYHTKVPHRAIMRYILHYTRPGDIVFDGFCGTGMTAVAAQCCKTKDPIISEEMPDAEWGQRYCIASDLSPEASFIAHSLNSPFSAHNFKIALDRLTPAVEETVAHLYRTSVNGTTADIAYTIWSEVTICPECGDVFTFSDAAVSESWDSELSPFPCPHCDAPLTGRQLGRFIESRWDQYLNKAVEVSKHIPVLINCHGPSGRTRQVPTQEDIKKARLEGIMVGNDAPIAELLQLDRFFKDSLHLRKLSHVHHMYTERTWYTLSQYWKAISEAKCDPRTRQQLMALFTSVLPRLDRLNRYMPNHNRHVGPLIGTWYISWLAVEISPIRYWRDKSNDFLALRSMPGTALVGAGSATDLSLIPDSSVDYIFTDPPFGHNLQYAELNQRAEAWIKVTTQISPEAVISKSQGKDLAVYESLMTRCFKEFYRILKPGRWMTVEFHNSRNSVWNAIQEALSIVGFVVADVRTLDKKKGTTNQLFYSSGAVKQDLVITAYKPTEALEQFFDRKAGSEAGAWEFLRNHLRHLPVCVFKQDRMEIVAERQNYLLYDRMVAFHVQRGFPVPLSASEFYIGLREKFPEREGMYFLPDQLNEYEVKRMECSEVSQLQLFVSDEKSAIQWVRLACSPKTDPCVMRVYQAAMVKETFDEQDET